MKRIRNASLMPLVALLAMMIALPGCNHEDDDDGNGGGTVVTEQCPEQDSEALIVTINPDGSVDPAHAEISLGTDPETGRPLKLQWYNNSSETYLIGLNNETLDFALPPGQYSYVLTAQYNSAQPVEEQIGAFTYNIRTEGGVSPPGTPDVDIGP